jgi:hypothetical protein
MQYSHFKFTIIILMLSAGGNIPWLMEPGGSMPHSQDLSNNPYPEPNQPNSPHWYLSLQGPFPNGIFSVGLPVNILKVLIPFLAVNNIVKFNDVIKDKIEQINLLK